MSRTWPVRLPATYAGLQVKVATTLGVVEKEWWGWPGGGANVIGLPATIVADEDGRYSYFFHTLDWDDSYRSTLLTGMWRIFNPAYNGWLLIHAGWAYDAATIYAQWPAVEVARPAAQG